MPEGPTVTFDVSSERQILTQANLKRICRLYKILDAAGTRLINQGEDLAWPSAGAVAVSERFFECAAPYF